MQIQPVSLFNTFGNNNKIQKRASNPSFSGEEKRSRATDVFLKNAAKSLALASMITLTPSMITSCEKVHIEEDCDHPNHINPPFELPNDTTGTGKDTINIVKGTTYKTPELQIKRYRIENGDTVGIGSVSFSEGVVFVPQNAHKSTELKTVLNFIEKLGLNSSNLDEEYLATRSFAYNQVPAQITWLDEKTGNVNQLKLSGYEDNDTNTVKMDLTTIGSDNSYEERQLNLTSAGADRLLVDVYPKGSTTLESRHLYTLDGNTITKMSATGSSNTFKKTDEFTSNGTGTSVDAEGVDGSIYKLANFDVLTAISEEN